MQKLIRIINAAKGALHGAWQGFSDPLGYSYLVASSEISDADVERELEAYVLTIPCYIPSNLADDHGQARMYEQWLSDAINTVRTRLIDKAVAKLMRSDVSDLYPALGLIHERNAVFKN